MKKDNKNAEVIDILQNYDNTRPIICASGLTKDYGEGRGIFDIDFAVYKGETVGYVGTNGSGKTTTIRHIMGFIKPQKGSAEVLGMDAWKDSCEIKRFIGYIPGEIAYPGVRTGSDFLEIQAGFYRLKDLSFMKELIGRLQLDPTADLRRMSKGMKQKTAIVSAFMSDPPVLILDEPTTGLDPLMRETFVELILEEKKKGKTVFMSSQLFDEVQSTCDRVMLLNNGAIVADERMDNILNNNRRIFDIKFGDEKSYKAFNDTFDGTKTPNESQLTVRATATKDNLTKFFQALKGNNTLTVTEVKYDFETYFNEIFLHSKK